MVMLWQRFVESSKRVIIAAQAGSGCRLKGMIASQGGLWLITEGSADETAPP